MRSRKGGLKPVGCPHNGQVASRKWQAGGLLLKRAYWKIRRPKVAVGPPRMLLGLFLLAELVTVVLAPRFRRPHAQELVTSEP